MLKGPVCTEGAHDAAWGLTAARESGIPNRADKDVVTSTSSFCNALQALDAAKAAVTGWEAASVASRRGALDAAKVAAEFSQLCHKFMRSVHRA